MSTQRPTLVPTTPHKPSQESPVLDDNEVCSDSHWEEENEEANDDHLQDSMQHSCL